jgi:hypothetical protein
LEDALYVPPTSSIVGDRFTDCVFNPVARVTLHCLDEVIGDQRAQKANVLFIQTEYRGSFWFYSRHLVTVPQAPRRDGGAG